MSNKTRILIVLTGLLMVSCYKPYTTDIENDEKVLVVDGLITNKVARYHIKLSYASQFYSSVKKETLRNARVTVTEDSGTIINFRELPGGDYVSDSTKFTASPGETYFLRIETQEGDVYESSPQKMGAEFKPDSVYAVVDYQNYISRFNQVLKKIVGATILMDLDGNSERLPEFRFDVKMIKFYAYALEIPPPPFHPPVYLFYCWQTDKSIQDLVISDPKKSSSNLIQKQYIDFVDNLKYLEGTIYDLGSKQPDQSYIGIPTNKRDIYILSGRIMYIDQFSLNDDAFRYYQKIQNQLNSEGKLFDPISVQIEGNIKCVTEPNKKVFGFFEVSALNKTAYHVGLMNLVTNQVPVKKITFIVPPNPNGCIINKVPFFWIV